MPIKKSTYVYLALFLPWLATALPNAPNSNPNAGPPSQGSGSNNIVSSGINTITASPNQASSRIPAPERTYNSNQIMDVYSSLTSSVMAGAMASMSAVLASANDKCADYYYYAQYYESCSQGILTGCSTSADATSASGSSAVATGHGRF
jgi:hypothetical protein